MQGEGYILFGAGEIGSSFIDVIGREKVLCFVEPAKSREKDNGSSGLVSQ